jgi:hypothetical protein
LLRPDAGKARDRRKQWIEQSRAHWESLRPFLAVMPGFMPGIHVFFSRTAVRINNQFRKFRNFA